jgi:transposase-like protein/IS1 family transposase
MICPECGEDKRIGAHSYEERRCKCHACGITFAESRGTVFFGLHYPVWVMVLILTLLAFGCPVPAIVAAFYLDERTVLAWQAKAGQQGKAIQAQVVCNGQVELGQVQADEIRVKAQGGPVWMATAMSVFARLFLWGEVSRQRSKGMIRRLMDKVRAAASSTTQAVLIAVDGFAAYPKAVLHTFYTKVRTGRVGRPRHSLWPDLHIVQVVKSYAGHKLDNISRRLAHGSLERAYEIIACSQAGLGLINTAFIERLNATFRARLPCLARRTRALARTPQRLEAEMFWSGVVYNFCTIHTNLDSTPAVAAGLTDHVWSVEELLRFRLPGKLLHAQM